MRCTIPGSPQSMKIIILEKRGRSSRYESSKRYERSEDLRDTNYQKYKNVKSGSLGHMKELRYMETRFINMVDVEDLNVVKI